MGERKQPNADIADLESRIEGVAAVGKVAEVDYTTARVRVDSGPIRTSWLPWLTEKAQGDRTWHAPEVGEQVVILAPGGDLSNGVVLGAIHRAAQPPPADRPTVDRTVYADGAVIEYDRENALLHAKIPGDAKLDAGGSVDALVGEDVTVDAGGKADVKTGSSVSVEAGGNVTIDAPTVNINADVNITGKVTASKDIVGGEGQVSLNDHVHEDVESGPDTSGKPVT